MMMSVRFAVGRYVDELGQIARLRERAEKAMREVLAARQQILEGHRARDRSIVEKDRDRAA